MCELCGRTPCHPRCPNAREPKIVGICAECNSPLREDDEVYIDDAGNQFCDETCVKKYYGIRLIQLI